MSMTTQQLVTKYHAERSEAKLGQQLFAIPRRDDMIDGQVFYYYVGDRRRVAVDFTKEICLHLKHLRVKSLTPRQYLRLQESTTPMVDLVQHGIIYPFLIFIDGYFIPWENMTIIASQEKYDILIHDLDQEFFDKINGPDGMIHDPRAIALPDAIVYHYNSQIIDEDTLFAFTEGGEFTRNPMEAFYTLRNEYTGYTRVLDSDIVDRTNTTFFFSDDRLDNQYKYFKENMFIFANGRLDESADPKTLSTAVMLWGGNSVPEYDEDPIVLRIFHNMKWIRSTLDNIARINIEDVTIQYNILQALKNPEYEQRYITAVKQEFAPSLSTKEYAIDNLYRNLDYLAGYDANLFNDVYFSKKRYACVQTDGEWVEQHRDEEGYFKIPRRFQDGIDFYIIVMVNGELFQYYRNHFYKGNYFYCPVQSIEPTDTVELLFFKDADNFEIKTKISSDAPYLKLDTEVYNDDLRIFCKDLAPDDRYFQYPVNGIQTFAIDYEIEHENGDLDNPNIRLRFLRNYYYDKDVVLTSTRRFKYFLYNILEDADEAQLFSIDLDEYFKYCNMYDKFIVFYNGKRLINDYYRLILPYKYTTPFYRAKIYLTFPFKNGDRLEIFYLPNHFVDVHVEPEVSPDGIISIDKENLPCAIDPGLCMVWSNCRKLPRNGVDSVDSTKLRIATDLTSKNDIRVSMLINDHDIDQSLRSRFLDIYSYWDQTVDYYGNVHRLLGTEPPTIEDIDPPLITDVIPIEALLNEIIRDWYVTNVAVDVTEPFLYDYDTSTTVGYDPGGNRLLSLSDSNVEDNLPVDRPWP